MTGLYIHIPFCASRCIYCGFYSTTSVSLQNRYVDALCQEIDLQDEHPTIGTIYLGGGTPSQLSHDNLLKLFSYIYNRYKVDEGAEITMECNPDDIYPGMFDDLPVNRVSMGAQTFSDERLHFLRRRHSATQVDEAVQILRREHIDNISLDLMFGFPGETLDDWKADIDHLLRLHPEHVSAYGLMYEDNTTLHQLLQQGKIKEIDEELSLHMYDVLVDILTENGYEHYEISNFARRGFRSRHNSGYWHNTPYIGLGASSHSYNLVSRSWNVANIKKYINSIAGGKRPQGSEVLDENSKYNDLITTALRTKEGLDISQLSDPQKKFLLENAKSHIAQGTLKISNRHLQLTRIGISISNSIMSDLMAV